MPNTQGGSEPRPGDLRKVLREGKRNEKMLFEAMTKRPKVTPAPAGGGISGVTLIQAGTFSPDGANSLFFGGWTFNTDPYGSGLTGPSVSIAADTSRALEIAEEGWYSFRWRQNISFGVTGAEPTGLQFDMQFEVLTTLDVVWTEALIEDYFTGGTGNRTAAVDHSCDPIWLPASAWFRPSVWWQGANTRTSGGSLPSILVTRWS